MGIISCIKKDFNIKFKGFARTGQFIREYIFENMFGYIFFIGFLIFSFLTFGAAYDSRENILQCIILILVGIVFGITGCFFCKLFNVISLNKGNEKIHLKQSTVNPIKIKKIMGIIFILFGIVFLLAYYGNVNIKNKENGTAIIIDITLARKDTESGNLYYPVIAYKVNEKEYIKEIRSTSGKYQVGDTVEIIYNSKNPDNVNIKPNFIFIIAGVIFLIAGIYLMKKKNNKKESV